MSVYSIIHTTVHRNYHSDITKCIYTYEDTICSFVQYLKLGAIKVGEAGILCRMQRAMFLTSNCGWF